MSDDLNVALPLRNVNTGAGVQRNYNQSGGYGNRQFNADIINYNETHVETRPEYTGTYSYTSLQPVASYVVRPAKQKQVEERLHNARAAEAAHTSIVVLVGLGGAGKTQLALDYIQTHRKEYSAVFWIDATLRESVERDYMQTYCLLFGSEQDSASLQLDVDRVITAVKAWFHGREGRWLFVFDNADSLDDETDPYFVNLQRYLPDAPCVEVVITTRSRTAMDMTELEAVEVGKLEPAEAIDIFARCCKIRNPGTDVLAEAARIVAELDYLVLAVTLAGAYVAATPRIRSNISEYLPEYRRRRKMLLGRKAKKQIHRYGESVLRTWETSYIAIAKQCPTAVRLLSFFAFLDSEDIFLELFRSKTDSPTAHSDSREDDWKVFLSADAPFEDVLDEALEALSTYSLIQWKEEQGGYTMHKLVHAWGFDRLEEEEQGQYGLESLVLLWWVVQRRQLDPGTRNRITPHILSSVARLRELQRTSFQVPKSSLHLIWSLADFMLATGQYQAEFELRSFEHAEWERLRDEDKPGWLRSLSDLANVYSRQGKYEAAEPMHRRVLEGFERELGEDHPDTLQGMSNLAGVLTTQEKYEAAEAMYCKALEGKERRLRKDHPNTLLTMNNLALVLAYQGKYEAAGTMNYRALKGIERELEEDHPYMLMSISSLAYILREQGEYEAAEAVSRRALEGKERKLGKHHPDTLTSVNNLAILLQDMDLLEEASQLYLHAIDGFTRILGKHHPITVQCQKSYADLQEKMGTQ